MTLIFYYKFHVGDEMLNYVSKFFILMEVTGDFLYTIIIWSWRRFKTCVNLSSFLWCFVNSSSVSFLLEGMSTSNQVECVACWSWIIYKLVFGANQACMRRLCKSLLWLVSLHCQQPNCNHRLFLPTLFRRLYAQSETPMSDNLGFLWFVSFGCLIDCLDCWQLETCISV